MTEQTTKKNNLYDVQAEYYLLALAFKSRDDFNNICSDFEISDFFDDSHKFLFTVFKKLYKLDQTVTLEGVLDIACNNLPKGEHINFIIEMSDSVDPFDYDYLKDIIIKKSKARKMMTLLSSGIEDLQKFSNYNDFVESITPKLNHLLEDSTKEVVESKNDVLKSIYENTMKRQECFHNGTEIPFNGIRTNYKDLDNVIEGLFPSRLTIIGARPGNGKTTLAMNLMNNMHDKKIAFFSLEMRQEELLEKLILMNADVDYKKYKKGDVSPDDMQNIYGAVKDLKNRQITIDDRSGLKPFEILGRARAIKATYGLDCIFIDYIQLMHGNDKFYESNQVKIASISRELKSISKILDVPIVVLAQLNREVERREGNFLKNSDLRESGSLEADADLILLLAKENDDRDVTDLKIHITKNRFGALKIVRLLWELTKGKIVDKLFDDEINEINEIKSSFDNEF